MMFPSDPPPFPPLSNIFVSLVLPFKPLTKLMTETTELFSRKQKNAQILLSPVKIIVF